MESYCVLTSQIFSVNMSIFFVWKWVEVKFESPVACVAEDQQYPSAAAHCFWGRLPTSQTSLTAAQRGSLFLTAARSREQIRCSLLLCKTGAQLVSDGKPVCVGNIAQVLCEILWYSFNVRNLIKIAPNGIILSVSGLMNFETYTARICVSTPTCIIIKDFMTFPENQ